MLGLKKHLKMPDSDLIAAYESKIPNTVYFESQRDGAFWVVRITAIDDKKLSGDTLLVSQAKRQSDIIHQVNDLLMTYRDIPYELRDYYERRINLRGDIKGEKVLVGA